MDGNFVGFAAVVMVFAVPLAPIYAWYRVRRLRTEERLAAIARGVNVPKLFSDQIRLRLYYRLFGR